MDLNNCVVTYGAAKSVYVVKDLQETVGVHNKMKSLQAIQN